jgi:triosephosphate isomerase (TIM)
MRTPILAGNWKMFKAPAEAVAFATDLIANISAFNGVERVVCPTFLALAGVAQALANTPIKVGAQNVHEDKEGAHTGAIAASMLRGLAEYVIIGHSEVRDEQKDTDAKINLKAKKLLEHGLKPIIAVGETDSVNKAGETVSFVGGQVRAAFAGIAAEAVPTIVVAYEPIWAIGTGRVPTGSEANSIIKTAVRDVLAELYGADLANVVRIQYGGSVKPNNMADFMSQPDIDGALVGGAAINLADFTELVRIAQSVKVG